MAERLGEALLELRTDDQGYNAGIAQAEKGAIGLGKTLDGTAAKADHLGDQMAEAGAKAKIMAASSGHAMMMSRQLSFQLIDIGQALATAPTMGIYALQNLGFQIAQIGQLYMGQGGFNQAIKDSARQIGVFATRFAPLAAMAGTIGAGFAGLTHEINRTGSESVSMADVMLASFQLIKEGIYNTIRPAIAAILPWWNRYWNQLVANTGEYINGIVGSFVGAYAEIKAAWNGLPAYFGSLGYEMADNVLRWMRSMARDAVIEVNNLIGKINSALNTDIGMLTPPKLGGLDFENPYAGSQYEPGKAFMEAFNQDYAGAAFGAIAERAREIASATDEITNTAGKAKDAWEGLRKVTGDTAAQLQERMQTLGSSVGGVLKGLLDRTMSWGDALVQVGQAWLRYMNQANIAKGGQGLFGGGFLQGLAGSFLGFFADGGLIPEGSFGIVGEAGPEPVFGTSKGAAVLPNSALTGLAGGGGRSVLQVDLGEGLVASILREAGNQSVEIARAAGQASVQQSVAEVGRKMRNSPGYGRG